MEGCEDDSMRTQPSRRVIFVRRDMKKPSQKKKLDNLVSAYIRNRDKQCVICGSTNQLTNGHLFSRRHNSLRWDIRPDGNCHTQCWPCNYKHVRDAVPYFNWYIKKFGKRKFDALYKEWNGICQLKDNDIIDMVLQLKVTLKD